MPGRARLPLHAAAACALAVLFASCGGGTEPRPAEQPADARSGASILPSPAAAVKPSAEPVWFEFGPDGPVRIDGPLDSSLSPFEPWTLARRVVGFTASGMAATAAVNRDSLLTLLPRNGDIRLYRAPISAADRTPYSAACTFLFDGRPAVLLYRDRFFVDPSAAAPDPRALVLAKGKAELAPADVALFAAYPASQLWDIDALGLSADGRWIFRAVKDGAVSYAAGISLAGPSGELSAGAYRTALLPRSRLTVDGALRYALEAAVLDLPEGKAAVATVARRDGDAAESFLVSRSDDLNVEASLARAGGQVDRAWGFADGERAYLLSGDGAYFSAVADSTTVSRGRFPTLPDGFVYSGIVSVGGALVASWEEQDGWSIGSAGLVFVSAAP